MFGYVVVNKPELKFKEYDVYNKYYCGLCKTIKERHGFFARFTLSYDLTFLALLLGSLYEPACVEKCKRCLVHPVQKKKYFQNKYLEYCSDMNVYLSFLKCMDDYKDEKKITALIFGRILRKKAMKIEKLYPKKTDYIKEKLEYLSDLENSNCVGLDEVSGAFGDILGEIFVINDDLFSDSMRKMGFFLGKFIYLCDAYDDLDKDKKDGCYNPFYTYEEREDFKSFVRQILISMMSECCRHFEFLPIIENVNLLRNILYSGVWTNTKIVQENLQTTQTDDDKK